ncbi:hypothetical protein LUW77_18085 [Streptomyces radiopugnans]|nr:hypothetical protein LUW77_18085 [Streptomyces radiopugnans]
MICLADAQALYERLTGAGEREAEAAVTEVGSAVGGGPARRRLRAGPRRGGLGPGRRSAAVRIPPAAPLRAPLPLPGPERLTAPSARPPRTAGRYG